MVDVAQDLVITQPDCGTDKGILMKPHIEGGEIIEQLADRVLGRVTAKDVVSNKTGELAISTRYLARWALGKSPWWTWYWRSLGAFSDYLWRATWRLFTMLWSWLSTWSPRQYWWVCGCHGGAINRWARCPANHAYLPRGWCRECRRCGKTAFRLIKAVLFASKTWNLLAMPMVILVVVSRSAEISITDELRPWAWAL